MLSPWKTVLCAFAVALCFSVLCAFRCEVLSVCPLHFPIKQQCRCAVLAVSTAMHYIGRGVDRACIFLSL